MIRSNLISTILLSIAITIQSITPTIAQSRFSKDITPIFGKALIDKKSVLPFSVTGVVPKSTMLAAPELTGFPSNITGGSYVRNQGGRGSCTMFASTAALEHYLYKNGFGKVDLSEEMSNHLSKMFWLHPDFDVQVKPYGAGWTENQHGGTTGGSQVPMMADGMFIGEEANMQYNESLRITPSFSDIDYWTNQSNMNKYNVGTQNGPQLRGGLLQPYHYRATSFKWLSAGNDPAELERCLAAGNGVLWTAAVKGSLSEEMWRITDADTGPGDGHAMFIVGYDKTDTDPRNHFFWVKNSWGPTRHLNGLTKVSYDFVRICGTDALYITGAEKRYWPQSRFFSRWHFVRGTESSQKFIMDIYHIPGVSKSGFKYFGRPDERDYRIGTMYLTNDINTAKTAITYRLNGFFNELQETVSLYFTATEANMPYDRLQKTTDNSIRLASVANGTYLVGNQKDYKGSMKGIVATSNTWLPTSALALTNVRAMADAEGRSQLYIGNSIYNVKVAPGSDYAATVQLRSGSRTFNGSMSYSAAEAISEAAKQLNPTKANKVAVDEDDRTVVKLKVSSLPVEKGKGPVTLNLDIELKQVEGTNHFVGINTDGTGLLYIKR